MKYSLSVKERAKRLIGFSMMILLVLQLCACTNEQKPVDDVNLTGPVGINAGISLLSGLDGVSMAAEAPYRCGYLIKELNGDGVPELLIGEISAAGKYSKENDISYSGNIPNWGVSYEDETGEIRRYSVSVSGMDGSIVLSPISIDAKFGNADFTEGGESIRQNTVKILQKFASQAKYLKFFLVFPPFLAKRVGLFV